MTYFELQQRVRSLTRDLNNSIFREEDVKVYINEAIDRVKQVIKILGDMTHLTAREDVPVLLPEQYHQLLAIYAAGRLFSQDERHYQSTTLMNEFEVKLDELNRDIQNGDVIIKGADGSIKAYPYRVSYVKDLYFEKRNGLVDVDTGVEGVK